MNLQIVSNSINVINNNQTNNFEMSLMHPIDALNNKAYIEVLNVCYPSTTKNVVGNSCYIDLSLEFRNFFKVIGSGGVEALTSSIRILAGSSIADWTSDDLPHTQLPSRINVKTQRIIIPDGIYNLERLIEYINNAYDEYDVFFSIEKNGKIKLNVNLDVEYWLLQTDATYTVVTHSLSSDLAHDGSKIHVFRQVELDKPDYKYVVNIDMSEKLSYMFGFKNNHYEFDSTTSGTVDGKWLREKGMYASRFADYLPDVSDGLNKIFVYCTELERVLVGDTSAELLCTIPIQWSGQGRGNGELVCFSPARVKKLFKKDNIGVLHISLRDSIGELVPFDSGTITIECLIHYA